MNNEAKDVQVILDTKNARGGGQAVVPPAHV